MLAIHAIADIVAEETLEGSRISLANEDGTKLVSIYPKVSGSISDAQVQAEPENRWSSESSAESHSSNAESRQRKAKPSTGALR